MDVSNITQKTGRVAVAATKGAYNLGKTGVSTAANVGVSAVSALASAGGGGGQQPVVVYNSTGGAGGINSGAIGLVLALIVGFVAKSNDSTWTETFFFAAIVYVVCLMFM